MYVRRYTAIGARDGATRITNPDLVATTQDLLGRLYTTHASLLKGSPDERLKVPA